MFTAYETRELSYPTKDGTIKQGVTGWVQGGCEIVWSELMPRVLAYHGESALRGERACERALELGAGCGLVDLLAGRYAGLIDITDGDAAEVPLIQQNIDQHATGCDANAVHLEWGTEAARTARADGTLRVGHGYDVILASQVRDQSASTPHP